MQHSDNVSFSVVISTIKSDIEDLKYTLCSMFHDIKQNFGEIILVFDGGEQYISEIEDFKTWCMTNGFVGQVVFHSAKKVGLTRALNIGIKLARSNYIFRIDSGDLWISGRSTLQLKSLDKGYAVVANSSRPLDAANIEITDIETLFDNHIIHSSAAFKREFYDEEYIVTQDHGLWLRILHANKKILLVDQNLCIRFNPISGISSKKTFFQLTTSYNIRKKYGCPWSRNISISLPSLFKVCLSKVRYYLFLW